MARPELTPNVQTDQTQVPSRIMEGRVSGPEQSFRPSTLKPIQLTSQGRMKVEVEPPLESAWEKVIDTGSVLFADDGWEISDGWA